MIYDCNCQVLSCLDLCTTEEESERDRRDRREGAIVKMIQQ